MTETKPESGIDWPEYRKLKIAVIVWAIFLALVAISFHAWNGATKGATEKKTCSVYYFEVADTKRGESVRLSTVECGELFFYQSPTPEQNDLYESMVGKKVEVQIFSLQRNLGGTPIDNESLRVIEA